MPATADEWVARRSTGPWGDVEESALKAWLAEDPANMERFEVAETLDSIPGFLKNFPPDIALNAFEGALARRAAPTRQVVSSAVKADSRHRSTAWVLGIAIAVGMLAIVLLAMSH